VHLEPPDDEERVADVLVGFAAVVVARLVDDLADRIGEKHHLPHTHKPTDRN
jgi:hypothetical protein